MRSLTVILACIAVPLIIVSCDQTPSSQFDSAPASTHAEVPASLSEAPGQASEDFVTTNPKELAEALRKIGNENEVNVALRSKDVPSVAPDVLKEVASGSVVAGVPKAASNASRRSEPGFAPSGEEAYHGLLTSLEAQGVEPYRAHPEAELMSLRIPDDKLVSVLATLLNHPNVDYVAANQRRPISFDDGKTTHHGGLFEQRSASSSIAGPSGSNSTDIKHASQRDRGVEPHARKRRHGGHPR